MVLPRPVPGRSIHGTATCRRCLPVDPGWLDAEFRFLPPDLMSWMEPCSLLASLPTDGGISSLTLEWRSGDSCTADTSLPRALEYRSAPPSCGIVSVHPNLCLSSSPGIKSPPEVTEDAKSRVGACLLGFTEQWKFCSALLSAKQILLNTFSFVPFLLLKAGPASSAEVQHNLIYSLLSLPTGALSHLICAFN